MKTKKANNPQMNDVKPRAIERPTEGFYALRLVKKGPMVPARLELVDDRWIVTLDGKIVGTYPDSDVDAIIMFGVLSGEAQGHPLVKVHAYGKMISETEYQRLLALRVWAESSFRDHPCLRPYEAIDLEKMPSLASVFWPTLGRTVSRLDNAPPEPVDGIDVHQLVDVAKLKAALDAEFPDMIARAEVLADGCLGWVLWHEIGEKPAVAGEQDCEDTKDFVDQISAFLRKVEDTRKSVKAAVDEAARVIQAWFVNGIADKLTEAKKPIETALAAYLSRQEVTTFRSSMGTASGLRYLWRFEEADRMELVRAVAAGKEPIDMLIPNAPYINSLVKQKDGRRVIPGLRIFKEEKVR